MGSYEGGVYEPVIGEVGWGAQVTDGLSQLADIWINVKAAPYGAIGDNSANDTAAIQAAFDAALAAGTTGIKTVFFPSGVYKTTGAITANITAGKSLVVRGQQSYTSSQGPVAGSYIYSSASNSNILTFTFPSGSSQHNLVLDGLQLVYLNAPGTGACLDLTGSGASGELSGVSVSNLNCTKGGAGIKVGGGVNVRFQNASAHQCTKGWQLVRSTAGGTYDPNVYQFDNCYAQASSAAGFSIETSAEHIRFTSCVFQSNTGPAIDMPSTTSLIRGAHFDSCWWEFPGDDMLRTAGGGLGWTFTSCRFDGSGNNRNVISFTAAAGSGAAVSGLNFLNPYIVNVGTGKLCNLTNTDPSAASDPFFSDVVSFGGNGHAPVEGLRPAALGEQMSIFQGLQWQDADIIANSVSGIKPRYVLFSNGSGPRIDSGLGVIKSGSGATGARPSATNAGAGSVWFDTTIGKPIFSNGSAWKLADGSAA